jgi:hypothetical protein
VADLVIERLCHYRQHRDLVPHGTSPRELEVAFGNYLGRHLARATAGLELGSIGIHLLCSTVVDLPFSSGALRWPEVRAVIADHTGRPPDSYITAYECASWGYALRYAFQRRCDAAYVMCSVVDINLLNLTFWRSSPHWGNSGFGLTTILARTPQSGAKPELEAGCAVTHNSVGEFSIALRNGLKARPDATLARPFFGPNVAERFSRQLGDVTQLPNLYAEFGHCFGSDPWVAILRQALERRQDRPYLAASLALSGYWAIAAVRLDSAALLELSEIDR